MKSYPPQRAPSSGGTSKLRHTRWRDTLAPDRNPGVPSAVLKPWRDTLSPVGFP